MALHEHLILAEKSLDVCRQVDDRLTPRRFLNANVNHLENIAKITGKLKQSRTADDRKKIEAWNATLTTLRRLMMQASEQIAPGKK